MHHADLVSSMMGREGDIWELHEKGNLFDFRGPILIKFYATK